MGEDEVLPGRVSNGESTGDEETNRRARIETAHAWLFDDDFVRQQVQEDLRKAEENPVTGELAKMAIAGMVDNKTGLYHDGERAVKAYDDHLSWLMPGGNLRRYGDEAVSAWGGRTGDDFARDFEEVCHELGIDVDEVAALNPSNHESTHPERGGMLKFYRYVYPVMEKLVLERGYTPSTFR